MYEYQIRHVNRPHSVLYAIEEMANDGWRLVAASEYDGGNSLYFERLKSKNKDSKWPQGNLTDDEWLELLEIEYIMANYQMYYSPLEYDAALLRLQELRALLMKR